MGLFGKWIGNAPGGSTAIGSTVTGATQGSVLFAGAGGVLAQDNTHLFWDATNKQLKTLIDTEYGASFVCDSSGINYPSWCVFKHLGSELGYLKRDGYSYFTVGSRTGISFEIDFAGAPIQFGAVGSNYTSSFSAHSATCVPIISRLAAAQTADAFQVFASDGTTKLAYIDKDGNVCIPDYGSFKVSGSIIATYNSGTNSSVLGCGYNTTVGQGTGSLFLGSAQKTAVNQLTGQIAFDVTNTAGGTTGAQTINKPSGSVNFAAGTSSLVVTNSLVSATSHVYAVVQTNDTTALIKNVVPAAGSFTIRLNASATAETRVAFLVIN